MLSQVFKQYIYFTEYCLHLYHIVSASVGKSNGAAEAEVIEIMFLGRQSQVKLQPIPPISFGLYRFVSTCFGFGKLYDLE